MFLKRKDKEWILKDGFVVDDNSDDHDDDYDDEDSVMDSDSELEEEEYL